MIWRAAVRAAARRPLSKHENDDDIAQEASEWLCNQLRRIACVTDDEDATVWLNAWPEIEVADDHIKERTHGWRDVYVSFLRAAFWRALSEVLHELRRHAAQLEVREGKSVGAFARSLGYKGRA